jgi:signal transduction histidine kinase
MDLRPTVLQGRRLEEALASLVQYLEDRASVSVTVDLDIDPSLLPDRYFVNIWHILRESFSNIEKYAHAKKVDMYLGVCDGDICLTIADDETVSIWKPRSWAGAMVSQTSKTGRSGWAGYCTSQALPATAPSWT